jgi:TonB family protein
MNPHYRLVWTLVLAVLPTALVSNPGAIDTGGRPAAVEGSLETVMPPDLTSMHLVAPHVRFLVTVNEEGALVDYLAIHASHFGLLERAERRLQRAKFSPALSHGAHVQDSTEVLVTFFDPEQRAYNTGLISLPWGGTPMDAAVRRMSEAGLENLQYRASHPSELDRPLELKAAKVLVMTDAEGNPARGECVVEFFIDDRGRVRLPRIVRSDNATVSMSALLTVRETQFAPITRKGMPTYVKVRQPLEFNTGKPTAVQ